MIVNESINWIDVRLSLALGFSDEENIFLQYTLVLDPKLNTFVEFQVVNTSSL